MAKNDKEDKKWGSKGGSPNPIQIQKFLGWLDFPATKKDILAKAKEKWADDAVMKTLEKLPDREYEGPSGISKEIGAEK